MVRSKEEIVKKFGGSTIKSARRRERLTGLQKTFEEVQKRKAEKGEEKEKEREKNTEEVQARGEETARRVQKVQFVKRYGKCLQKLTVFVVMVRLMEEIKGALESCRQE